MEKQGSSTTGCQVGSKADLVFVNGNIITMDEDQRIMKYVGAKNGQIIAVQSQQKKIKQLIDQNTQIIDLKGHTLLPGFIDPHIHYTFSHMSGWIDLSPFTNQSNQQIWYKIVDSAKSAKPGEWIRCYGYDYIVTPGQNLNFSIEKLDQISLQNPIFIIEINYHVAYANSAAFAAAKITNQSPDPPHSRFVRDQLGNLTGRIQQIPAINYISKYAPAIQFDQYVQNIHKFFQKASSKGCTSLHDCGIGAYEPKMDYEALQRVMKQNPCIRMSGFLVSHAWEYWKELGLKPEKKDKMLRINGIKCWSDGSIQCGSAFLKQPYIHLFCGCGAANYSQEYLDKIVEDSHKQGWQIGIHANGDAAIQMVIKAYEKTINKYPKTDIRHRIEHCTMCNDDQFEKMKKLNVHPSFLIGHIYYYGQHFSQHLLGERGSRIHCVKSALDHGLKPTLHSDDKCQPIDPLRCIYNAVTRRMKKTGQVLNKQQKVNVYEAIKMMTISAAWQCHKEDIVGSIQVGKLADFVVLDKNILQIPEDEIIHINIKETWMNGIKRYQNTQIC